MIPALNRFKAGTGTLQDALAGIGSVAEQALSSADGGSLKGADLTNADETITVAEGDWRVLPAATLSATHAVTLSTAGAAGGDQITITRRDATANTYTVVDGGTGTPTIFTFPVSKTGFALFEFDGAHWAVRENSPE